MGQEVERLGGESGCSNTSTCSDAPAMTSPASSSSTATGFGAPPSNVSECTSAAVESSSTSKPYVAVGPFVFNDDRLRTMEMLAKPDAPGGAEESRDRSKSARKALANSGRRPTSSFKGVNLHCRSNRWETHIWDGHQVHVGCFDTELQAAIAYDIVAIKLRGAKAKLNFAASSYEAEAEVLEKMSRDEVLMAMRGVTIKEEPTGGEPRARDSSPPRTRKHARQATKVAAEAAVPLPRKRRRVAPKHGNASASTIASGVQPAALEGVDVNLLKAAHANKQHTATKLQPEIDHLSEPHGRWQKANLKITTKLPYHTQAQASLVVPDSPTLVHPQILHPSELIANHQPTIWTTQDTCSLLPSHWLSHAAVMQSIDDLAFDDCDYLGHSGTAFSSDTDLSDDFLFDDLEQPELAGAVADDADWQAMDFSPRMLLLEPDYTEPLLHGA